VECGYDSDLYCTYNTRAKRFLTYCSTSASFLSKNLSVTVKFIGILESSSKLSIYEYGLRTAHDGRHACVPIAGR
jgi:hypothetical protein